MSSLITGCDNFLDLLLWFHTLFQIAFTERNKSDQWLVAVVGRPTWPIGRAPTQPRQLDMVSAIFLDRRLKANAGPARGLFDLHERTLRFGNTSVDSVCGDNGIGLQNQEAESEPMNDRERRCSMSPSWKTWSFGRGIGSIQGCVDAW